MKRTTKIILLFTLLAALVFPTTVFASSSQPTQSDDKVIFGGTYTLESGQTLDGNLAVFGGTAKVDSNARVNGDVVLAGGTLDINGEINGNITTMGGSMFLGDTAVVHGDVTTLGAAMHRSNKARIDGKIVSGTEGPFQFSVPQGIFIGPPNFNVLRPITDTLWFLFQTLALAALALLLVLFIPNPTNRVADAITAQPILAGGLGLLTVIVAPIVLVLLAITIILIPVSLIGIFILIVGGIFGWIGVGLEVGKRIAALFKSEWPLAVAAGVGTFVTSLIVNGIGFIPCVGWLAPFIVGIIGLGAIILTRFGTRIYPPAATVYTYPVPPTPGGSSSSNPPVPPESL